MNNQRPLIALKERKFLQYTTSEFSSLDEFLKSLIETNKELKIIKDASIFSIIANYYIVEQDDDFTKLTPTV